MRAKTLFAGSFILAGVTGIFMVLFSGVELGAFFMIFVLTTKLGVASGFNVIYIAHPKMFPTLFSMTSMGILNLICRFATIFAPFVAEVDEPVPMFTFTVTCFIASLCAMLLIEPNMP